MTRSRRGANDDFVSNDSGDVSISQPCAWMTRGLRCQMMATMWLQPIGNYEFDKFGNVIKVLRPGYCAWHYECLRSPRLADDFAEFERLQVVWHQAHYCNQFVHHPASYVWDAMRGRYRDQHERVTVTPCEANDCWVPDALGMEPAGHPVTEKQGRASIAAIIKRLAEKMDAKGPA